MNNVFSEVPSINVPRSVFNRSCSIKSTIGCDFLYPIYCDECLPADTFSVSAKLFGRLSTPVVPLMDDLYLDTFWFAVPNRLVDPNWKKIMGESTATDPNSETYQEQNCPVMTVGADKATVSSLHDYLGLPLGVESKVLPYFHRAYNLIWNEWFRDENLSPFARVGGNLPSSSGAESASHYVLKKRAKRHDYFTSCLPWPQKGPANGVAIGLAGSIDVYGNGNPLSMAMKVNRNGTEQTVVDHPWGDIHADNTSPGYHKAFINNWEVVKYFGNDTMSIPGTSTYQDLRLATKSEDSTPSLVGDLNTATSVSVNQLRQAFATQHFYENSARGGSRYVETLLVHFGVTTPDARLQRPEYLGGSSMPLNVTAVPQTSATDDTSPQGNLAAFVTGESDCHFTKTFVEHSIIMCIVNIRATVSYQQGLARKFTRRTRFDFYWPEFANLGEQTVLNKEIYAQGTTADDEVFGYQERYAEYRYNPNIITGRMRSTAPASLDVWHLAEKFSSLPTLSHNFINCNTPLNRAIAVTGDPNSQFILDGYFQIKCARPMPVHSVPGLSRL